MQDMEFTIQEGKLWMLQTRNGKRTGAAMVRIADGNAEAGHDRREDRPVARGARAPERTAAPGV
jgi:hypothetical protein